MKSLLTFLMILLVLPVLLAQNVMISNSYDPNEPSIQMDPNNPNILVAGANLKSYYYSSDGGITWDEGLLSSTYGVWGDPVIEVDTAGDFYFFHLSNPTTGNWIDRIVCQKSTSQGMTWSSGTFTGLNGTKIQDKQWSVVDRTNNIIYLTWTQFDEYDTPDTTKKSSIQFSKSTDAGLTWSAAQKINEFDGDCLDSDNTVEGATPAVGPNGEVYVTWAGPNGLVFNRSLDGGTTWLNQEIPITNMPGGWDFAVPGIYRCNGLPFTKCDLSGGPNHGTIYVNWSDQRNGANDTDIWLIKSTDGGNTWSTPIEVNDDNSNKHQFLTSMDIDQTNGHLYFVFYDRRAYTNNQTDVYMAISQDGGATFWNKKISETPFVPNAGVFFGDYTDISVHNGIVRPIWARLDFASLSVWTNISPLADLLLTLEEDPNALVQNQIIQYPNPANDLNYVSFKLHEFSTVNLEILDQEGRLILTVMDNEQKPYGKYIVPIKASDYGLSSGTYNYRLRINGAEKILKTILIIE
jgi:hypothetical protein